MRIRIVLKSSAARGCDIKPSGPRTNMSWYDSPIDLSRCTEGRRRTRPRSPRPAQPDSERRGRCAPGPRPGAGGLGDGSFALRGANAGEHRGGIAVQDLLARFLADLRLRERLPGPVTAELGAVGAAH